MFAIFEARVARLLDDGRNVIADATHARRAWRANVLALARQRAVPVVAVWFQVPLATALARNALKPGGTEWGDRIEPAEVLVDMSAPFRGARRRRVRRNLDDQLMFFASPWLLLLLLVLPFIVWLGWPSRGPSRQRETISLGLRLVIAMLADCGPGRARTAARRPMSCRWYIWWIIPNSMPAAAQQAALDYVRQAIASMGPHDQSAVVVFGGDAVVERPLSASKTLEGFTSKVASIGTNLADAIRLGMALLPGRHGPAHGDPIGRPPDQRRCF